MNPFDAEGLWLKSRLFINRALDPQQRDFEERAFWACASLELLGKSAMARVSPLLVANPSDDGKSLLVASGMQDTADATSVQAKAVWARCAAMFKPFNQSEAKKLSVGRNEYIHSATIGFDAIPEYAWWPSFWAQAVILLQHVERSVGDYVGSVQAIVVEGHLATQRNNLARQLEARLENARSTLARHTGGTLTARMAAQWDAFTVPVAIHSTLTTCPACGAESAILGGDEKNAATMETFEDDERGVIEAFVTLEVNTDFLACSVCHLVITEYELLAEADVETAFDAEGDFDDLDYEDYNNE